MTPLEQLIIAEIPSLVDYIKVLFTKQNPNLPPPTSDEITAAYQAGFTSSVAKDDAWLAAQAAQRLQW